MMFGDRILKDWDAIEKSLAELIAIPSVRGDAQEGMPFGKESAHALQYVLELADSMGLSTENIGNYAGHAEYGTGETYSGVLTHIDVVPAGDGWSMPPFALTKKRGVWYGRGVADNKGSAIVALYCLKALKDAGIAGKRRMRVIFGAGEETGSEDMSMYFSKNPLPDTAFTPDADYTVCNREKGILQVEFSVSENAPFLWAGEAVNAVPGRAEAQIAAEPEWVDAFHTFIQKEQLPADVTEKDGKLQLSVSGISTHAMEPQNGRNAATALFRLLFAVRGSTGSRLCDWIHTQIGSDLEGKTIGVACSDAVSGALTLNVGIVRVESGKTTVCCDLRYPVTKNGEEIAEILRKKAQNHGIAFRVLRDEKPLYLPPENPLIRLLCGVYEDYLHTPAILYATGGGTYARTLQGRGVAYGALLPNARSGGMHTASEHIVIDEFQLHAKICLEAMYRMMLAD